MTPIRWPVEVSEYLVGSPAFKAGGTGDPRPAGSIPVHLRQQPSPVGQPRVDVPLGVPLDVPWRGQMWCAERTRRHGGGRRCQGHSPDRRAVADDANRADQPSGAGDAGSRYDLVLDDLVQSTLASYGQLWQALVRVAGATRSEPERAVVAGFLAELELRFADLALRAGGGRLDGRWSTSA